MQKLKYCSKNVQLLPGSDFLRRADEMTVRLCFVDFDYTLLPITEGNADMHII